MVNSLQYTHFLNNSFVLSLCHTVLEINFEEADYSIEEGVDLSQPIRMQFRTTQNDFTLILCPLSIEEAEKQNVGDFIDFSSILDGSRATSGDCQLATAQ